MLRQSAGSRKHMTRIASSISKDKNFERIPRGCIKYRQSLEERAPNASTSSEPYEK
jgi:hypothetical protein